MVLGHKSLDIFLLSESPSLCAVKSIAYLLSCEMHAHAGLYRTCGSVLCVSCRYGLGCDTAGVASTQPCLDDHGRVFAFELQETMHPKRVLESSDPLLFRSQGHEKLGLL